MGKKLTIEYIRDEFEKEGYTLLSEEYKGSGKKLDYICSKGHNHSIMWSSWQQKHRCPSCAGLAKPTLEQVSDAFKKDGYVLLSKEYVNSKTKLDYICFNGYKYSVTWNDYQKRNKHKFYKNKRLPNKFESTFTAVKQSFEKEGYILLSKEYINCKTKLNYICHNGHEHSIKWNDWQQGKKCPICANIEKSIKNSGPGNYNWQGGISCEPYCQDWTKEYKNYIKERDGYKCLNPYCSSKKPEVLAIHHIDYNKKNCHYSNLITICRSCNSSANKDRDWHKTWYQAIIKNRYGGVTCL